MEMVPVSVLRPYARNARPHSRKQVSRVADGIRRFGFTNPVLVGDDGGFVARHGRVMAAKQLGMSDVPVPRLSHLTPDERRAYVLAGNEFALNAGWDSELLGLELQALIDLESDVTLTGFSLAEIDLTLDRAQEAAPVGPRSAAASRPSPAAGPLLCCAGSGRTTGSSVTVPLCPPGSGTRSGSGCRDRL
jgi:ParB-like chromosome segregation protein Spo0J